MNIKTNVTQEQVNKLAGRWVQLHRMATVAMKQADEQKWKRSYGMLDELRHTLNIIDRHLYEATKKEVYTRLVKEYGSAKEVENMSTEWTQWRQKLTTKDWRKQMGFTEEAER